MKHIYKFVCPCGKKNVIDHWTLWHKCKCGRRYVIHVSVGKRVLYEAVKAKCKMTVKLVEVE